MLYAGIYLSGAVLGFFISALTKGKDGLWDDDFDKEMPILMTFFWPVFIAFMVTIFVIFVAGEFPKLFFWLLNKAASGINSVRKYKFSSGTARKRIAIPIPVVDQSYRQPGPYPCIACGSPTSINQSNMECVESASAQAFRLDI